MADLGTHVRDDRKMHMTIGLAMIDRIIDQLVTILLY